MMFEHGSVIVKGSYWIDGLVDGCLFIGSLIYLCDGADVRNCVFESCIVQSSWGHSNIKVSGCTFKEARDERRREADGGGLGEGVGHR